MEYLRTSKLLFTITRIRKIVALVQTRYCSNVARTTVEKFKSRISSGPTFQDFIKGVSVNKTSVENSEYHDQHTYFSDATDMGNFRKGSSPVNIQTCPFWGQNITCTDLILQFILRPMAVK